jgi:thiol-disulfide isomerase/thioredoxin
MITNNINVNNDITYHMKPQHSVQLPHQHNEPIQHPFRRKLNHKHIKSKSIFVSPKIKHSSIKGLIDELKKQIDQTKIGKKVDGQYKLSSINKPIYIIKLFFSDNCHHCVSFKPIWNKMKEKYANRFKFIDINCTYNAPEFSYVSGYPTISIYDTHDRYISNYSKVRTIETFNEFLSSLK